MDIQNQKPILLAGSHRSGTTWVGKILSSSKSIGYIMEPFNLSHPRPGLINLRFDNWFQYITKENDSCCIEPFDRMLKFQYDIKAGLTSVRTGKDLAKVARDYYRCLRYKSVKARPLVKEPTAIFIAPWFAETFNADVILLIRHPAAFVSSLMILQWRYDFSQLLRQTSLMRDYLYPFDEEINLYARTGQSILDQAILLWRIVHYTISLHQQKFKSWLYLRHEDLSMNPLGEFEDVFAKLDIKFDDVVRKCINKYSSKTNPSDTTTAILALQSGKAIKRDSMSNIYNWKNRLSEKEIDYIRVRVEDISKDFYSDKEW